MNYRKPLSRFFPSHHPRKGQPTYFVEKVWSANVIPERIDLAQILKWNQKQIDNPKSKLTAGVVQIFWDNAITSSVYEPKGHTIREGHNVKVGDTVEFYIWSGKPYNSPQIVVTPRIPVLKTWDIILEAGAENYHRLDNITINDDFTDNEILLEIAKNDGLSFEDFEQWFQPANMNHEEFRGQIICWNDSINY